MKIEEIEELWSKDSKIDRTDLANESLKIPELHNKYYKIYLQERVLLKKYETELDKLKLAKRRHLDGKMDLEELKEHGWKQQQEIIVQKDLSLHIDADDDIIKCKLKLGIQSEKVEYLRSILDRVNKRSFTIKNAIEFIKFTQGI